jgi:hypothetical protein
MLRLIRLLVLLIMAVILVLGASGTIPNTSAGALLLAGVILTETLRKYGNRRTP